MALLQKISSLHREDSLWRPDSGCPSLEKKTPELTDELLLQFRIKADAVVIVKISRLYSAMGDISERFSPMYIMHLSGYSYFLSLE